MLFMLSCDSMLDSGGGRPPTYDYRVLVSFNPGDCSGGIHVDTTIYDGSYNQIDSESVYVTETPYVWEWLNNNGDLRTVYIEVTPNEGWIQYDIFYMSPNSKQKIWQFWAYVTPQ